MAAFAPTAIYAGFLPCIVLTTAIAQAPASPQKPTAEFRVVARQRATLFVVATPATMRDRAKVQQFARQSCAGMNVCFVHFWTDARRAARSIPMTDPQVNAMVASYNINRNTGNDRFQCYNFGSTGERCA